MAEYADVMKSAMSLQMKERAALAEQLLASLDDLDPDEAERLWSEEAQRRLEEYHSGRAATFPAEQVHEEAERLLH